MGDQSHKNYFDADFNNNDIWANINPNLVSTNHQNLGDNNYIHQNPGGDNFDHQNSQIVRNNYINQNSGEILQNDDIFNQNSSLNDIIYQNPTVATNINHHPNNSFGIGEGSYQNGYFNHHQNSNTNNSMVTVDQNNNEQLLIYILSQLQNIKNAINQILNNNNR